MGLLFAGLGVALKVVAPIVLPGLMDRLEKKLPETGSGPERRRIILNAIAKLAGSLENDGLISKEERAELLSYVPQVIETFVPQMNATKQSQTLTIRGGTLELG